MKTHTTATTRPPAALLWLLCAALLALVLAPATAHAAEAAPAAASAVAAPSASSTGVNWGEVITGTLALLTSVFGIWSHREKKTAQKVNETLIVGIEQAARLPVIAHAEKALKASIQKTAEDYGVQPVLHRLVRDLTSDDADALTEGRANLRQD